MSKTVTFLQLAPEFGGTKFGPFTGVEIRLGSDPERNDITLPETLGVSVEHIKVLRQQDGSFILAPIDRTTAVFHWRAGSRKPRHITTPMAVHPGDAFSLVTAEGPRFILITEADRAAIEEAAKASQGPGMNIPKVSSRGLMGEIRRVGLAKVMTTRVGHAFQNGWRMIKTGQIFSPMYIVMGMTMMSGWLFAGGAACTAFSFNKKRTQYRAQLTDCRDQLGVSDDGEGEGDPTVPGLTKKILLDRTWPATIEADQNLYSAYTDQLEVIFAGADKYAWAYTKKGSDFVRFKEGLEGTGMPENLVRVLAYAGAMPGYGGDREWAMVPDSDDAEVCGRGPLGLTWAQGYRLGLSNLQLDAMVERQVAAGNDVAAKQAALEQTAGRIDAPVRFDQDLIRAAGAELQGGMECLYVDGNDDRTDPAALAKAIQRKLGTTAIRELPTESGSYWIAARLVKLYTYDFRHPEPADLTFDSRTSPSTAMDLQEVKASRKNYAVKAAATVIARAVAVPCLASLDKEKRKAPPTFLWELPNLGSCAIVKAFVEYDQL